MLHGHPITLLETTMARNLLAKYRLRVNLKGELYVTPINKPHIIYSLEIFQMYVKEGKIKP